MNVEKKYTENRFEKYHTLLEELREMISSRGRGYSLSQQMNNQFWEELGTHRQRMLEQIERLETSESEKILNQELKTADSLYQATRNYLAKKV